MPAHAVFRAEDTQFDVAVDPLIETLRAILPGEGLIVHEAGRRAYECDGLSAYKQLPLLVAVPETIEQVQAILRACSAAGVPVVTRGAGTSLSGGALPHPQGLLLAMGKFNRIHQIDAERRIARIDPGVRNLAISEAAAPYGLYYAPIPHPKLPAQLGAMWVKTPVGCIA